MTTARLPTVHEIGELARLRALQLRRARAAVTQGEARLAEAEGIIVRREAAVAGLDRAVGSLAERAVNELAPELARWGPTLAAERERLLARREIEAFMLADEIEAREQAARALGEARAALARAVARDDMAGALRVQVRAALAGRRERAAETEGEDVVGARFAALGVGR